LVASNFGLRNEQMHDKALLLGQLERFFERTMAEGKRCLLVIDEVQNLPFTALEELRMLSNITIQGRSPFQCLLLGQPQFRQMLCDARLEQLEQRVLASYHLAPLNAQDTKGYVEHRLRTSGWSGDPEFEEPAFVAIHKYSSGIPRRINTLCSRALLAGYLEETHVITEKMLNELAEELRNDLGAGIPVSAGIHRPSALHPTEFDHSFESRLSSLERAVSRHERAIRRILQITVDLLEDGI